MSRFIDERALVALINERTSDLKRELTGELEKVREEIEVLASRQEELVEKQIRFRRGRRAIYQLWTGLISFVAIISVFLTVTSTVSPIVGISLIIASGITFALFIRSVGE